MLRKTQTVLFRTNSHRPFAPNHVSASRLEWLARRSVRVSVRRGGTTGKARAEPAAIQGATGLFCPVPPDSGDMDPRSMIRHVTPTTSKVMRAIH